MKKLEQAISYFEDAIRESDEIIAECSEELQEELNGVRAKAGLEKRGRTRCLKRYWSWRCRRVAGSANYTPLGIIVALEAGGWEGG